MSRIFARQNARLGAVVLSAVLAVGLMACTSIGQDPPSDWSYDTRAVVILNTDWGIIPLPNDLLDYAVTQTTCTIPIYKGDTMPEVEPFTLALPIMTEAKAAAATGMSGHTVTADDPLSIDLKNGQNKLNGFVAGSTPTIPFSQKIDPTTLVPYDPDASDADKAKATLFFINITDRKAPQIVSPKSYLAIFNWEARKEMPYYLTIGLKDDDGNPVEFAPGSRYLVVVTKTLKSLPFAPPVKDGETAKTPEAREFERDATYLLFVAKPTYTCKADNKDTQSWCSTALDPELCCALGLTYVAPDGSLRNNILGGNIALGTQKDNSFDEVMRAQKEAVRSGEAARQITQDGLLIFDKLLGSLKTRDDVLLSYTYTVSSNPLPNFGSVGLTGFVPAPTPFDKVSACAKGVCTTSSAKAATTATPSFKTSRKLAADTVTKDTVRLYKINSDATPVTLEAVPATPALGADGKTVTLTPQDEKDAAAKLNACTTYAVAVSNGLMDEAKKAPAADQTYFGLSRASVSLLTGSEDDKLEDRVWASPLLDNRFTAVMTMVATGFYKVDWTDPVSVDKLTNTKTGSASKTLKTLFQSLDNYRQLYAPSITWLLDNEKSWLPTRENLVLFYTFTTDCTEGGAR